MTPHVVAFEKSLALHAAVAARLAADPAGVERARARVDDWLVHGGVARHYAEAWRRLLDEPVPRLVERLVERSEVMHDLRQVSPFAGVLDARTRWRMLDEVQARFSSPPPP